MHADNARADLVLFAQPVGREHRGLDCAALGDEHGSCAVEPMLRKRTVASARGSIELCECVGQRVGDIVVEEWPSGGCTKREALLIEHGSGEHGFVEVVPYRQAAAAVAEQQFLRNRRCVDVVVRRADEPFGLVWRQQAYVLRGMRRLLAVHDDQTGYQRCLAYPPCNECKVGGLLHVVSEQHEAATVSSEMNCPMTAAERPAMGSRRLCLDVEHKRCVPAGSGDQQVLYRGKVLSGQVCCRASAREREAGCRRDQTARPVGCVDCPACNQCFRRLHGAVAVEHRHQPLVADVASRRRTESVSVPMDCDVAEAGHHAVPVERASWSWNCSRSSQTMALVGQRNTASGVAGPPAA